MFIGCGLDTFYVIDAPTVNHEPSYNSMMQENDYFKFTTNEEREYEGIKFLGTEVYYKIYDNSSRLNTEYSSINSASSSDTSTNQAADRMIINYKFHPLRRTDNINANIFIPVVGSNRPVEIRLSDYVGIYQAGISIDYDSEGKPILYGQPVRDIPNNPSFNFKELSPDQLPKSDDEDFSTSSSTTDEKAYYVCMFAVAVAQDATYSRLYSNVVYLGSVKISLEN